MILKEIFLKINLMILVFIINQTASFAEKCTIVEDNPNISYSNQFGKLSDFWVDEVTGIDLIEKERLKLKSSLISNLTITCDTNKNNHSTPMISMINGVNKINPSQFYNCRNETKVNSLLQDLNINNKSQPILINISMDYNGYNEDINYSLLSNHIVVSTAGNDWDKARVRLDSEKREFAENGVFIAGALSSNGLSTTYSQEGPGVSIMVPVGYNESTYCLNSTNCKSFGGTSSAAPKLTYVFKAIRELLPKINRQQLKTIMDFSAISTIHNLYKHQDSGVGALNGYKMWVIAKTISSKCIDNTEACVDQQLNQIINNFKPTIELDEELYNQAFQHCTLKIQDKKLSCTDKNKAFDNLRSAYLLNSNDVNLKNKLMCAYSSMGYSGNASYLQNMNPDINKIDLPKFWNPKLSRALKGDQKKRYLTKLLTVDHDYTRKMTMIELFNQRYWGIDFMYRNSDLIESFYTIVGYSGIGNLLFQIKPDINKISKKLLEKHRNRLLKLPWLTSFIATAKSNTHTVDFAKVFLESNNVDHKITAYEILEWNRTEESLKLIKEGLSSTDEKVIKAVNEALEKYKK